MRRSWRLNERHYGALQGKNRVQVRQEFGDEQFMLWRRSYDTPPPLPDPDLRTYDVVLIVAHGNSLRALKKHLDGLSDEDVIGLNVPTGIPLVYELDDKTMQATRPATYLDPEAAAVAIEAVANQGKSESGQELGRA